LMKNRRGRGGCKVHFLKRNLKTKMEFPGGGGGGGFKLQNLTWRGMDMFWNNTLYIEFLFKTL